MFQSHELRGLPVRRVVLEGDPATRIVELAHSEGVNLIVMPTHGYGPFRRFILGSVTTKVLHDADCPVFTGVHLEERPHVEAALFQNILCAIDLGPQSRKVLEWAAGMAAEVNARFQVVHALPELDPGQTRYFDPDWRIALDRAAREQVEEFLLKAGTPADIILDTGDVSKIVRLAAEYVKADLVVIGRHVDSGILGRLRAHAYTIIREAPCPVISI